MRLVATTWDSATDFSIKRNLWASRIPKSPNCVTQKIKQILNSLLHSFMNTCSNTDPYP